MNGRIIDFGRNVPPGYVVAAEVYTYGEQVGLLTGSAQVCTVDKGDELFDAGTHTTYGTWEAFEADHRAQQSMFSQH